MNHFYWPCSWRDIKLAENNIGLFEMSQSRMYEYNWRISHCLCVCARGISILNGLARATHKHSMTAHILHHATQTTMVDSFQTLSVFRASEQQERNSIVAAVAMCLAGPTHIMNVAGQWCLRRAPACWPHSCAPSCASVCPAARTCKQSTHTDIRLGYIKENHRHNHGYVCILYSVWVYNWGWRTLFMVSIGFFILRPIVYLARLKLMSLGKAVRNRPEACDFFFLHFVQKIQRWEKCNIWTLIPGKKFHWILISKWFGPNLIRSKCRFSSPRIFNVQIK